MWHSVAPAPVASCILMSKMLRVRVTLHGWYRTEKPPSISRLSEGTSQSIGFLGIHLVCGAAAVSHFMFRHRKDDWRATCFYANYSLFCSFLVRATWTGTKKDKGSAQMKASELFIQPVMANIDIIQLCYSHTLSPSTNGTCSSSRHLSWLLISHSPWLTSISCQELLLELAGKDHNARTRARLGRLTILLPDEYMSRLAGRAELDPAGLVTILEQKGVTNICSDSAPLFPANKQYQTSKCAAVHISSPTTDTQHGA